MGKKKMKLLPAAWQWRPSCKHPRTLSFRAGVVDDEVFKTVNSMFFDIVPVDGGGQVETTPAESWFTKSSSEESSAGSFSTESADQEFDGEVLEMVVRGGARSERLFFEPGGDTSSILKEPKGGGGGGGGMLLPLKESVVMAMESNDPYVDFRRSMEEMVETHGLNLKDWDCLEEMLGLYLKVNGKANHGFIISAFIDLLVALTPTPTPTVSSLSSSSSSTHSITCYSSAVSSFPSSPNLCSKGDDNNIVVYNEIIEEEDDIVLP